jgi:hypothetical protein
MTPTEREGKGVGVGSADRDLVTCPESASYTRVDTADMCAAGGGVRRT